MGLNSTARGYRAIQPRGASNMKGGQNTNYNQAEKKCVEELYQLSKQTLKTK